MAAPSSVTSVVVVEDVAQDYEQISSFLASEAPEFQVTRFDPSLDPDLRAFKAEHPDHQIVVVDMALDWIPDTSFGGLQVIRSLWAADRSMFFIVFTRHDLASVPRPPDEIDPLMCLVRKDYTEVGLITVDSLRDLLEVLRDIRDYCAPSVEIPHHDSHPHASRLPLLRSLDYKPEEVELLVRRVTESVGLLQTLSNAAAVYTRMGRLTSQLTAGAFGSLGRLEARPESDVELMVIFTAADLDWTRVRSMAVEVWNRLTFAVRRADRHFEGERLIAGNTPQLLLDQQGGGDIGDGYTPVMDFGVLVATDPRKLPHIRHKYCQLLLEMRCVFNPRLLLGFKRDLITQHVENDRPLIGSVIDHPFLAESLGQFLKDVGPAAIREERDRKPLLFRTANVLATRLALVQFRQTEGNAPLGNDSDWHMFLDALSAPGIAKVLRAVEWLSERAEDADRKVLGRLSRHYTDLLLPLMGPTNGSGGVGNLRPYASRLTAAFADAFDVAERLAPRVSDNCPWLVDRSNLDRLFDWI